MTNDDVYIAEQVERALAQDERTHELGVHVAVDEGAVVLRGEVAGEHRQQLVAQVAAEAAPGLAVRNEVSVTEVLPPDQAET
jgi:osmotically-inducible protein OsmY